MLRPATPQDLEAALALRNDPASIPYFKRQRLLTREEYTAEWDAAFGGNHATRKVLMIEEAPQKTIGALLFDITPEHEEAEVSIYVDRTCHGKGIGTHALQQGCEYAFNQYNVRRITAVVHQENTASMRAFTKAGFTPYDKDGKFLHYDLWRKA